MRTMKHLFSIPPDVHYLNCAYMSPLPKPVEEAGIAGMRRKRVPSEIAPSDFFEDCDEIRRRFARLINVEEPSRIAIVPSASYGLAVAARNTRVEAGQRIVVAADQFPSNVYVWRRLAREANAELTIVPAPESNRRSANWSAALADAIGPSTAVVALGHTHWTDGTLFDLRRIGERARQVGAAFVIDGTQSVGALPFDARELSPDALICAGYKWLLGPYGIGVAYFGERYDDGVPLEETWIGRRGSEDFRRLVDYQDAYRPGAIRYDAGESSNFINVPMLKTALGLILDWGVDTIQRHCRRLVEPLAAEAAAHGWPMEDASGRGGHIVGLRLPSDFDVAGLRRALDRRSVSASLRGEALRVSPHLYNDEADIEALLESLREAL